MAGTRVSRQSQQGFRPAPRRIGRTPQFSRDQLVDVALRQGLNSFTVASLADEIGVGVSSLYRVIEGRDDLILFCVERIAKNFELPAPGSDYLEYLRDVVSLIADTCQNYPGLGDVIINNPVNALPLLEYLAPVLVQLREYGVPDDLALWTVKILSEMVFLFYKDEYALQSAQDDMDAPGRKELRKQYQETLDRIGLKIPQRIENPRELLSRRVEFILAGLIAQMNSENR